MKRYHNVKLSKAYFCRTKKRSKIRYLVLHRIFLTKNVRNFSKTSRHSYFFILSFVLFIKRLNGVLLLHEFFNFITGERERFREKCDKTKQSPHNKRTEIVQEIEVRKYWSFLVNLICWFCRKVSITNMHTHRDKVIDFHISSMFSCVNSLRKTSLHAGTSPIAILWRLYHISEF